jgi:hypothetical protein
MKYLLLLLVPVLLSTSSRDQSAGGAGRLYLYNMSPDCTAVFECEVCHDESCNTTARATYSVSPLGSTVIDVPDWEDGVSFFCTIKASLGAGQSSELELGNRCGTGSSVPVVDCNPMVGARSLMLASASQNEVVVRVQ